jgi:hypothetical protein
MLQNPEFDSKDIDPDLHQQMAKAVDDSSIKCFNPLEGAADGDQDLNLWSHEMEEVCPSLTIMEDPAGCADAAVEDGRHGSNVYEVNTWLWQFGRGKPRLGGLTIKETLDRQDSASKASDKRQKETCDGSNGDGA